MPAAPFSPRGLIGRRLNGLATELCEKCGLAYELVTARPLAIGFVAFLVASLRRTEKVSVHASIRSLAKHQKPARFFPWTQNEFGLGDCSCQ